MSTVFVLLRGGSEIDSKHIQGFSVVRDGSMNCGIPNLRALIRVNARSMKPVRFLHRFHTLHISRDCSSKTTAFESSEKMHPDFDCTIVKNVQNSNYNGQQ